MLSYNLAQRPLKCLCNEDDSCIAFSGSVSARVAHLTTLVLSSVILNRHYYVLLIPIRFLEKKKFLLVHFCKVDLPVVVVLYGCETWCLTLMEECRRRVFENKILRRIFGPKRDQNGEWRRLHNEELHSLYHSPKLNLED